MRVDIEEPHRILPKDLPPRFVGEGDLVHFHRVVEVMVRPVRGEDGIVLTIIEFHQRRQFPRVLRLLYRLGGEVPLLEVVAGPLLEEGNVSPPFEVFLIHLPHEEGHPRDTGLGDRDAQIGVPYAHAVGDHVHYVGHYGECVATSVPGKLSIEDVIVEGEDGVGNGDAVQQHWQVRRLRCLVDGIVLPVSPERVDSSAWQVNPDDRLEALNEELEIPSLRDLGLEPDRFESVLEPMAEAALDSGSPDFNPRQPSKEEIIELYRDVYYQ